LQPLLSPIDIAIAGVVVAAAELADIVIAMVDDAILLEYKTTKSWEIG